MTLYVFMANRIRIPININWQYLTQYRFDLKINASRWFVTPDILFVKSHERIIDTRIHTNNHHRVRKLSDKNVRHYKTCFIGVHYYRNVILTSELHWYLIIRHVWWKRNLHHPESKQRHW